MTITPTKTTSQVNTLFNNHLERRLQKMLYKTPVLYELADKHPLPGGVGTTIYIPKQATPNTFGDLTEGTIITPSATSAEHYTGTVKGGGDAKVYSDFLVLAQSIPTLISDDLTAMTKFAGYWVDELIRDQIESAGTFVSPDGSVASGSVLSTTNLRQRFLFDASTTLAGLDCPTYDDGNYAGVFHPVQIHDLFVSTSAGAQLGTVGSAGYLEGTESGAKKLEMMSLGVLGKVRVLESTQSCQRFFEMSGMSAGASSTGRQAFVMGPGAVAAIDLQTARLKHYMEGFGEKSGTVYDPIHQHRTAGVKLYFGSVAMDTTNRLVRTVSGITL